MARNALSTPCPSTSARRVLLAARSIRLRQDDHADDDRGLCQRRRRTDLVDGADIAGEPPQKRGFGMVFQNYAIFPHLNVFENVAFPLRARGIAREEIGRRVGRRSRTGAA